MAKRIMNSGFYVFYVNLNFLHKDNIQIKIMYENYFGETPKSSKNLIGHYWEQIDLR